MRQPEQLGLGHAVLCAERAVGNEPFAVLLADDFITDCKKSVTASLVEAFSKSGKSQLSIMKVDGPEISKYGVIIKSETEGNISGIVEKPAYRDAPSNLASIGRYVNSRHFRYFRKFGQRFREMIQLLDAINFQAQMDAVNTVVLRELDLIVGPLTALFLLLIMNIKRKAINKLSELIKELSCFKTYDIRGEVDVNINAEIVYRIGRALSQHFSAKSVVIGYDARETSPTYASAIARGVQDFGSNTINIGLAVAQRKCTGLSEFGACGVEITASYNPINYNGIKIVKSKSQPLDEETDFKVIKKLAETAVFSSQATAAN